MSLADHLRFFIPTSLCPWHPDTRIIEQTIVSTWEMLGEEVPPRIYCDMPPSWATVEHKSNYQEYIIRLEQLDLGQVIIAPEWVGLVGLFSMLLAELDRPLILNVQHDWEFVQPDRVDTPKLVECMLAREELQSVRFTKRPLPYTNTRRRLVDRRCIEVDLERFGIPLIATGGWGDSPHFARQDHYHRISELINSDHGMDGRYGLEGPIYKFYTKMIKRQGFTKAQRSFGSFMYGRFHEPAYVHHIGNASGRWRKKLRIKIKRG